MKPKNPCCCESCEEPSKGNMSANTSAAVTNDASTNQNVSLSSTSAGDSPKADTVTNVASSSSSYANIVQKDGTIDKEKIKNVKKTSDDGLKKSVKAVTSNTSDGNDKEKSKNLTNNTSATSDLTNDTSIDAEDDSFTPVVSHNRKDRNNKRNKEHQASATATARNTNSNSNRSNKSQRQGRDGGGRSKDGHSKRSKSDKDKSAPQSDSSTGNVVQSGDKVTPTPSEAGTSGDDANGANANEKKFIEAPLPKVNAWKVSSQLNVEKQLIFFH